MALAELGQPGSIVGGLWVDPGLGIGRIVVGWGAGSGDDGWLGGEAEATEDFGSVFALVDHLFEAEAAAAGAGEGVDVVDAFEKRGPVDPSRRGGVCNPWGRSGRDRSCPGA